MNDDNKVIDMVEEDVEIDETKISKVKNYIKGNWKKIALAVGAVAVGAIGYTLGSKSDDTVVYDLPPESTDDDVENVSTPEE